MLGYLGLALTARNNVQGFTARDEMPNEPTSCRVVGSLEPGQYCDVFVSYEVTNTAGAVESDLAVSFQDRDGQQITQAVQVVAQARAGWLTLTEVESGISVVGGVPEPGGWNFKALEMGTSATKRYKLRNQGRIAVSLRRVTVTPAQPVTLPKDTSLCEAERVLKPGDECVVQLMFAPSDVPLTDSAARMAIVVRTAETTLRDDPRTRVLAEPNTLEWVVQGWAAKP